MKKIDIKPLSVNEAYADVIFKDKSGKYRVKRIKTAKYKTYSNSLAWLLPRNVKIHSKLQLNIKAGFKTNASDIDNPLKPFIDILQKFYNFNDNRIFKIEIEKEIVKDPYIAFELSKYEPSD